MKRKLLFVLATVFSLIIALGLSAAAAGGSISYEVKDGEAIVTGWDYRMTTLIIPDSLGGYPVTEIDPIGMSGCATEEIRLPESVVRFDDNAFHGAKKLRKINIPSGVTELPYQLFMGCEALSDIELPQGLEAIGRSAFDGCTSLKEIVLPEGLRSIGMYAFSGTGITELVLPKSVENAGSYIVENCKNLERIVIKGNISSSAFVNLKNLKTLIIEEGVESVEDAFSGSSVEEMVIPGSLTYMGRGGFPQTVGRLIFPNFNEENFIAAGLELRA